MLYSRGEVQRLTKKTPGRCCNSPRHDTAKGIFAMRPKSTATYKPTVKLTGKRGHYRVQSGTDPNVYYETSVNSCSCPARKPCRHMKFVRGLNIAFYVKKDAVGVAATSLPAAAFTSGWDEGDGETGLVWRQAPAAFQRAITSGHCAVCGEHDHYLRAGLCVLCEMDVAEVAAAGVDAELAAAEQLLARKRRALADTDAQDDLYATLLRQVDQAERAVAARSYSAFRAA